MRLEVQINCTKKQRAQTEKNPYHQYVAYKINGTESIPFFKNFLAALSKLWIGETKEVNSI